jgi:ElaA protein
MLWTWSRFDELGVHALYDALALRSKVFVLEQDCPYLDPDGYDPQSWHLLGRDPTGALVAYLRVVDPGLKFDEPSIGRVVTLPELRRNGLGRELMREGMRRCAEAWPGRDIRIGAQARLQRFYRDFDFETVSDEFLEDGIAHVEMLWRSK